jgi:peptidoglycan-N-acetylglucosamine deacetylase
MSRFNIQELSRFHICLIGTAFSSVVLYRVQPTLILLPICLLAALILAGPFAQRLSFFLPIVTHGDRAQNRIVLSFDDGPDPQTTPRLLDLLSTFNVKATFFVIGQKAHQHPDLIKKIVTQGHLIGNHSYSHDSFLMLRRARILKAEIVKCQNELQSLGIKSLTFRPPVGITNPKLGKILTERGMICLGFSCRAADFGNRRVAGLAKKILKKLRKGDIVMLHDRQPAADNTVESWLSEIETVLNGIQSKGLEVVPLSDLIEHPVMKSTN